MYLVLNAGSSSLKCKLFSAGFQPLLTGLIDAIGDGTQTSKVKFSPEPASSVWENGKSVPNFTAAFDIVNAALEQNIQDSAGLRGIAHRVVHGGSKFHSPVRVSDEVLAAIEEMSALAPLHNPSNLLGIRTAQRFFPSTPHVAIFDTAFHHHLSPASYLYAIPRKLYNDHGIRRYGFHGTSYWGLLESVSEHINKPKDSISMIAFHLGAGCSACCVQDGKSADHTMGLTPLEGLVMGTRPGDLDSGTIEMMYHHLGLQNWKELSRVLNKDCGLKGLCGESDMRQILHRMSSAEDPDKAVECREAVDVFVNRAQRYLGAYLFRLENKVDAIAFTGGIGENSSYIRERICKGLDSFGIHLDSNRNQAYCSSSDGIRSVSSGASRSQIVVCPADEEVSMAKQTATLLSR